MTITVPISLTADEQATLQAQAEAQGVSIDVLLRKAILQIIATTPEIGSQGLAAEEWEKEFEEWLDGLSNMPTLSDEAISRESIYTRDDEWR